VNRTNALQTKRSEVGSIGRHQNFRLPRKENGIPFRENDRGASLKRKFEAASAWDCSEPVLLDDTDSVFETNSAQSSMGKKSAKVIKQGFDQATVDFCDNVEHPDSRQQRARRDEQKHIEQHPEQRSSNITPPVPIVLDVSANSRWSRFVLNSPEK
jgi:hypothetical protein